MVYLIVAFIFVVLLIAYGYCVLIYDQGLLSKEIRTLRGSLDREIRSRTDSDDAIRSTQMKQTTFNADVMRDRDAREKKTEETFVAAKKEIELLIIRQRTLEKKILTGERTFNVTINKSKPSTGRGRSALIPEINL